MTGPCFVDANVLLYSRDPRHRAKQERAHAWLERLWREGRGRTSMQVLSEFYYNATRKLVPAVPPEDAWVRVRTYFAWGPQAIDEPLLRRAREIEERWRLSWWDSMVVAAAQLQDCTLLLTEDLQDGAVFGTVVARSPFTLSVEEPAAGYAAAPVATLSRHRPRGRPRRTALA
jgi:predicted nucleic acid-binding protein